MPQQLNLLDARFVPQPVPWSAQQALLAGATGLALCLAAALGLQWRSQSAEHSAQMLEAAMTPLRQQLVRAAPAPAAASGPRGSAAADAPPAAAPAAANPAEELARLRLAEAAQRRVRHALESGVAGQREGPSEYLMALARQAPGSVWITGLSLSDDGLSLDLTGQMSDTRVFADYLRRLNAEPRLRGRPFAQLQLEAVGESGSPAGVTAFSLRSAPAGPGTATGAGS